MRVIAGKARRLHLKTVHGYNTRPTTDRVKETLFNIINNDIPGAVFLDLFSGSGAIGIEALSRGAKKAYFVENNREAVCCIRENLDFTRLAEDAYVMTENVENALKKLDRENIQFDFIFMDPPYNRLYEKQVLIFLAKSDLINRKSQIIVEASLETDFSYVSELHMKIVREKRYKTNKHVFLKADGE